MGVAVDQGLQSQCQAKTTAKTTAEVGGMRGIFTRVRHHLGCSLKSFTESSLLENAMYA